MNKIPLVCIVGPTASGKSDFAVSYALEHNGEIISADSRQVYKGLDIGTGKISEGEMKGIPHYLLDVVSPEETFNVERYKEYAQKAIEDIHTRGKLPILVGGTGFYIDALVSNISYPNVPHNDKLREELKDMEAEELFKRLSNLDLNYTLKLNNSEKHNKQRLIRSIEIAEALGHIPPKKEEESPYDVTWIHIKRPEAELRERIHTRVDSRIKQGMIEEVENLHAHGLSWERMEDLGLEYRYISRYLRGILARDEMISLLKTEIWHYAKRQILWFRDIP